jgi:2-dehydro-3-deoxyphosphogluconate aldolase/(4S)-4-hydroxy-2-oxoglutarate aldolase
MTAPALAEALARRIIPVITIDDPDAARGLAGALVAGGLPVAEVTLRTAQAEDALRRMAGHPAMLVGAGTVTRPEQVERVAAAGARFVVSPGFDPEIVQRCRELGLAAVPGVSTASELQAAARLGLDLVKLFPAEAVGGLPLLRALAAPFPGMRFLPTGGITLDLMPGYLAHPAVAAIGGSWLAPAAAVAARDWSLVTSAARQAVDVAAKAPR